MKELKPCPFCGSKTVVKVTEDVYQIIGCSALTMLCPMPSMVVYKNDKGGFDYTYWNKRYDGI